MAEPSIDVAQESEEPYFVQFKKGLLERLRTGAYKAGDKLPSENVLCGSSDVSIRTVRRALAELEREGVLFRRQGRGTFLRSLDGMRGADAKETGRKGTICLLFTDVDLIVRPSFAEILRGVEATCQSLSYHFNLQAVGVRYGKPLDSLVPFSDLISTRNAGGFIVASPVKQEDLMFLRSRNLRFVTFQAYRGFNLKVARSFDWTALAQAGIQHLASLGHRRIGVIGGFNIQPDEAAILGNEAFMASCQAEVERLGIEMGPELTRWSDYTEADGRRVAGELLSVAKPPTAIFAVDDLLAKGAITAARAQGLNVPGDLAVLGCNDTLGDPGLSSIRLPLFAQGKMSVEMLDALLRGTDFDATRHITAPEVIARSSTGGMSGKDALQDGSHVSMALPAPQL